MQTHWSRLPFTLLNAGEGISREKVLEGRIFVPYLFEHWPAHGVWVHWLVSRLVWQALDVLDGTLRIVCGHRGQILGR